MEHYKLIVLEKLVGLRLDKVLSKELDLTRTRLQQLIKNENVRVNGTINNHASYLVKLLDHIEVLIPPAVESSLSEADIELNVVYEDDDLLVINKQPGLTVHPGAGQHNDTLVNALMKHCKGALSGIGGVSRPGIVHRLDRDTSGLMVVAKNDISHVSLSEQISQRSLKRVYNALVWGNDILENGMIKTNIGRNLRDRTMMQALNYGGKEAITYYRILERYPYASLVECRLMTGRTHQIRVHMSHIGHSIVGDQTYGHNSRKIQKHCSSLDEHDVISNFKRQALHSVFIQFMHPKRGEVLEFSSTLPLDILEVQKVLKI